MGNDQINIMRELVAQIKRLNENLEAQARRDEQPEYVGADEAARIVGLPVTKSRSHRNRLTAAYKRGLFPQAIPGRPFKFHRGELQELARKRAAGEVVI